MFSPRRLAPTAHRTRRIVLESLEHRHLLDAPEFTDGEVTGIVDHWAINAASGLVASRDNAGVLWLHNDAGDSRLFAVNRAGNHLATFQTGIDADDWEDIAVGPGPLSGVDYLYIADTGDNSLGRAEVAVHRVAEPNVAANQTPTTATLSDVARLRFRYPDGPHDTETLIVDPNTGDIYLITKRDARSQIYRAAYPQSTVQLTTLEFLGELTWSAAAAGDIAPAGDALILKDLHHVYYYDRPAGATIRDALAAAPIEVPYIAEPLGEGLTFDALGDGYFTHSEGNRQPLYYFARVAVPIHGDLNGDGEIDRRDVTNLASGFGMDGGASWANGDLDGDGSVNLADLALLQSRLGESSESAPRAEDLAAAATITEPGSLAATGADVVRLDAVAARRRNHAPRAVIVDDALGDTTFDLAAVRQRAGEPQLRLPRISIR